MKKLTDYSSSESYESLQGNLQAKTELNSTLKKCQSLMTLQKMMIIRSNPSLTEKEIEKNINLEKKYNLDVDTTNKQSMDFINKKLKNFFNMSNYEQNIKKEAWKKDLSKLFLGINTNDKDNKYEGGDFEEYNFANREKKKAGLLFIRNFFCKMKSVKNKTYKLKDKIKENDISLNKYEKFFYKNKDRQKINEEDINLVLNKLKIKYSPQKENSDDENKKNDIKFLTEINDKSNFNLEQKYKKNVIINRKNLFNSHYHLNEFSKRINTELNKNTINPNSKYTISNNNNNYFPTITVNNNNKARTIINESRNNKKDMKNIKLAVSDQNIFDKNKNQKLLLKGINRNKTYLEKLKKIYKNENTNKKRNNNNKNVNNKNNNFEMPQLLKYREKPLFKKNNQLFFSPLHYSKYAQMKEIKDKLVGIGFLDNEVFAIYNKNI